jgi:CDP-glycerol glycerophosphotransferase (TagB/SpsB family)
MSLANPDLAIVWGAKMRDEVIAHHDLPAERIREGGVPHYDLYFRPETFSSRQEFCRGHRLDPDRPIVLYAAMSPRRFPYNPAVVEILARTARALSPERPAQILVRLHPIYLGWRTENPTGWAAEEARFKAIAEENGNVALMLPKGRTGENGSFDLDEEDNRVLANCLQHSSLVVCFFSTLNLEAAILDKPIINCALFDLQRWLGPDNRTVLYPTHLTNLLRSRACRMAYTEDELRRYLGEYLADPKLDSAARASLWQAECGSLMGRSARRVANLLAEAAGC